MEWTEDSVALTLRDSSHPARTFYKLNQLRKAHQLCDVEIKVRSASLVAHKAILASNSPHILSLLRDNHASIVFDDPLLNVQAMNTLFEFIYTSVLRIAKSNVQPLCYAARYLQMERIEKACCKFMSKNVSGDCISYYRFARMHGYTGLEQQCCEFISSHLDFISVTEMSVEEMAAVLQIERLALDADGLVRVICQWIAHDFSTRVQHAWRLLDSVRTPWLVEFCKDLSRSTGDISRRCLAGASVEPEYFFRALRHRTAPKYLNREHAWCSTSQYGLDVRLEPAGLSGASSASPIAVSGFVYTSPELETVDRRPVEGISSAPSGRLRGNSKADLPPKASVCDCISPQKTLVGTLDPHEISAGDHAPVGSIKVHNAPPPKVLADPPETFRSTADPQEVGDHTPTLPLSASAPDHVTIPQYDIPLQGTSVKSMGCMTLSLNSDITPPGTLVGSSSGHFTPTEVSLKSQLNYDSQPEVSERVRPVNHIPTPMTLAVRDSVDHISQTLAMSSPDHISTPEILPKNSPGLGRRHSVDHVSAPKPLAARCSVDFATKPEEKTAKFLLNHISPSSEGTTGIVYVAGGSTAVSVSASVEKYNPTTGTWTQAPNLPKRRSHCALAYVGKKLYVMGGLGEYTVITTVDIYDPQVGMWQEGPQMPRPKSNFGVAVLGNAIYCIGGSDGTGDLTSVDIFDLLCNRWKQGSPLTHPRSYVQAAVLDGAVYAVGGSKKTSRLSTVEKLITNDSWETVAGMNTPRSRPAVGTLCGKLYAVGGYDGTAILRSAECYAPGLNQWTMVADMSTPRNSPGIAVVGVRLLVCGGYNGKAIVSSCEFYDPEEDKWLPGPAMHTARCNFGTTSVSPVVTNTWL